MFTEGPLGGGREREMVRARVTQVIWFMQKYRILWYCLRWVL